MTPPDRYSGYYLKKRKWPLKGYHKRFFIIDNGYLKYGKNEEIRKVHGKMDLGDVTVTSHKKGGEIHLDCSRGSPIHVKPLNRLPPSLENFEKLLTSLRLHQSYRKQTSLTALRKSGVISPWSSLERGSCATLRPGAIPSYSEYSQIDGHNKIIIDSIPEFVPRRSSIEQFSNPNEKISHIEQHVTSCENFIVQLTQIRADCEDSQPATPSPKKATSRFSKSSMKRNKREGSKHSSSSISSNVTDATGQVVEDSTLSKNKSLSQPDLTLTSSGPSGGSAGDLTTKTTDTQRDFEDVARKCISQMRVVLNDLTGVSEPEKRGSLERANQTILELRRENQELRLRLEKIQGLASIIPPEALAPRISRSLQREVSGKLNDSIDGSTTELFFDAESDLYMSGDSSDEDENLSDIGESNEDRDSDSDTELNTASAMSDDVIGPAGFTRRSRLPVPMPEGMEVSLWNVLKKNIGKDLTKVAMPVSFNEPLSALQKMAEDLEYSFLLDQAAPLTGVDRMIKVAAFALSCYAAEATRRGRKPFNPILGETFELIREDLGWKFVAEQVSHHPPIGAGHCSAKEWSFWFDSRFKNKFWGKSIEIHPLGKSHLQFKDGEKFSWKKVTSCVHNIMGGEKYVEKYGDCVIESSTGIKAKFTFVRSGWMSSSRNDVVGEIRDQDDKKQKIMFGKWDEGLYVGEQRQTARNVWRSHALTSDNEKYYGFTRFAIELNEVLPGHEQILPHTDSRWRTDQQFLEQGRIREAESEKIRIEDIQRTAARKRAENSVEYQPRFFTISPTGDYIFNSVYWSKREDGTFWPGLAKLW